MKQEPGRQPPGIPVLQGGEDVKLIFSVPIGLSLFSIIGRLLGAP